MDKKPNIGIYRARRVSNKSGKSTKKIKEKAYIKQVVQDCLEKIAHNLSSNSRRTSEISTQTAEVTSTGRATQNTNRKVVFNFKNYSNYTK